MLLNAILNSFFNSTALHLAVENNNSEIVQLLLTNKKINVNSFQVFYSILNIVKDYSICKVFKIFVLYEIYIHFLYKI